MRCWLLPSTTLTSSSVTTFRTPRRSSCRSAWSTAVGRYGCSRPQNLLVLPRGGVWSFAQRVLDYSEIDRGGKYYVMMKRIEAAIAVILIVQAYFMLPVRTPDALDWMIFVGLIAYGAYFVYYSVMPQK